MLKNKSLICPFGQGKGRVSGVSLCDGEPDSASKVGNKSRWVMGSECRRSLQTSSNEEDNEPHPQPDRLQEARGF